MTAYHGTTVRGARGTQALCQPPFQSGLPCVYLSADKALASIYIWKHPFKWMTFEIGEDGIPVYNESFKDGLRAFYGGVKGSSTPVPDRSGRTKTPGSGPRSCHGIRCRWQPPTRWTTPIAGSSGTSRRGG